MLRALTDPHSYYCLVNCHLLSYEMCRHIDAKLTSKADIKAGNDLGVAFIYAEEARDTRIRVYLDKYLVRDVMPPSPQELQNYVMKILRSDRATSACDVDPQKSVVHLLDC